MHPRSVIHVRSPNISLFAGLGMSFMAGCWGEVRVSVKVGGCDLEVVRGNKEGPLVVDLG